MTMIFWDLDDVTADFMGAVSRITGTPHHIGGLITLKDWATVRQDAPRIFKDLDLVKPVKEMIDHLADCRINQAFLTALPDDGVHPWPWAGMDKVNWVQKYFPDMPIFFGPYSHQKLYHCKPGDILIDDRQSNITEWESAGGIGHLYRTPELCKNFIADFVPHIYP